MAFTFKHGDRPIEGYEIKRGLGRGGFGEVYYAISDGGREVALKYLHSFQDIELRGVSHCINMKSPNLVSIFDVVKNDDGECFVIMEYVSGPSLRDMLIAEPEGLGTEKATFFLREIARGLSYLHERGIVHRDLKPGNIFYEEGYVKIGDYGLSKFIAASAAGAQTQSVGTVHYMAPEVGSGRYSSSIDIYALGVILYEMLLGKVPFEGQSTGEVLMKHLMEQPEVDQLPQPFPGVIRKALAKDPNDRYASVKLMIEDVLGAGRFERFDTDSLTPIAAFAARNLRQEAPTMPTPTAPDQRPFAGSSGVGLREE
ncbi:MAG: serine/threonine protein kinase, partial [Planctomycetes bacterium]|nr:serine/threonine protein kinase [Planctomycetota bacterium]